MSTGPWMGRGLVVVLACAGVASAQSTVRDGSSESRVRAAGPGNAAARAIDARVADTLEAVKGGAAKGLRDPKLEAVALFEGPMPTGVTVSREGRIFLCFPRWQDPVEATVAELRNGRVVAYPDAQTNTFDIKRTENRPVSSRFVSVQSVVMDSRDRLWILDTGSIAMGPVINGAPKLLCYDIATGREVYRVTFPNDVAMKKTYLNDVRIDLKRGEEGTAYITDSGVGGIIVVDLASRESWRHLDGHPSVMPTPQTRFASEGEPLIMRKASGEEMSPDIRSDGIALSGDGATLYYNPLMSREVYAVPTELLAQREAGGTEMAAAVKRVAMKPSANDGLLLGPDGAIYSADWEDNAIRRIDPESGAVSVVVQDERMVWPDTLAEHEGSIYIVSNQLARQPNFHSGRDRRKPPYALFRYTPQSSATGRPDMDSTDVDSSK